MPATAICPICNGVSWTGETNKDVPKLMDSYNKEVWCTCSHVLTNKYPDYPPKSGTGDASRSSIST